jgi:hypothetical protein
MFIHGCVVQLQPLLSNLFVVGERTQLGSRTSRQRLGDSNTHTEAFPEEVEAEIHI